MLRLILLIPVFFTVLVIAGEVDNRPVYNVGIKVAEPFAYKEGNVWKGLSVDLIDKLSTKLGFNYVFEEVPSVAELLNRTKFNGVDFSITAISMTDERERYLDFSHSYFTTSQGILIKENGNIVWFIVKRVLIAISLLGGTLYLIGFIVSRLDPDDTIDNTHKGAWFALVTFTTTGYGDYVPSNAKAKVFAALLMVSSLFLLSAFTGYISSALTVEKLTSNPTTLSQLHNSKVVTIKGSTGSEMLNTMDIPHTTVTSIADGVGLVEQGKAKAFVYDKAMLDYATLGKDSKLQVWPVSKGQERYAIAFPQGSDLVEAFNVSILDIVDTLGWKSKVAEYFGN